MSHASRKRLTGALIAGATASVLATTPALATDPSGGVLAGGPIFSPPGSVAPIPLVPKPATGKIKSARLFPRTMRHGKRPLLRIKLTAPSRLQIVVRSRRGARRIRVITVPAHGSTVWVRLPARAGGHLLRAGRYPVRIIAIDANGTKSRAVVRTLRVKR